MSAQLLLLNYGNKDISEWDGSDINPLPQLNGFWLESSLKISPKAREIAIEIAKNNYK